MDRSRTDRILEDWDLVSSHAGRPSQPPRGHTMRSSLPGAMAALAALVVIALAASAIWFSRPSPLGVAGGSPSPTPSAQASDAQGSFSCSLPLNRAGNASGAYQATLGNIRISKAADYDRIVFEYGGTITPTVTVESVSPPFTQDPSGQPLTLAGSAFLRLKFEGTAPMSGVGFDGPALGSPIDPGAGYAILSELAQQGDYEGVQTWLVGLSQPTCVRVTLLTSPTRLVVDLQH